MATAAQRGVRATPSTAYTGPYADLVNRSARANGLDPWWLAALLFVENRFRRTGGSSAGAEGIAQIRLPSHPDVTKAQADDPAFAIPWAARYLASLKRAAGGSITRGTALYNTGPNADESVIRSAGTAYVDQVKAARSELRQKYGAGTAADSSAGVIRAGLAWPLAQLGKIIGRPYEGTHRDFGNWESDNAVDLAVPVGTPVFAVDNGVIGSKIGDTGSGGQLAGKRLHLVTGNDEFYYAHLSRLVVKAGQKVRRGQLLGYSGSANGVAHLHIGERASFRPDFASDPHASTVSFWSGVGSAVKKGAKWTFVPGSIEGSIAGAAGVDLTPGFNAPGPNDLLGPLKSLANVGDAFGRFLADPAYPFLWLLFMLTGFALLYLGVTRLFGVRPARMALAARTGGAIPA
jgi:murein DD-endopeptidase MepM/ murein hydrolase activator NlpD